MTGATGGAPIAGGINATQYLLNGASIALPSGTQGQPLINTTGAGIYATSPLFNDCSQFPGLAPAATNTCLAAISGNGGVGDARAFSSSTGVGISTQLNVGTSSGTTETLLLPPFGKWISSDTTSTDCALKQWHSTSIQGTPTSGLNTAMYIAAGGASNVAYIYCNDSVSGGGYFTVDGLSVFAGPSAGATASGVGALIQNTVDGSDYSHMAFQDQIDPVVLEALGTCCNTTIEHGQINAGYVGTPLNVLTTGSTNKTQAFNLTNESIVHPGVGLPFINIADTSGNHFLTMNGVNLYHENNNSTDLTTSMVQAAGARALNFENVTVHCENATTAPYLTNSNNFNTGIVLMGLTYAPGGTGCGTYPITAVVNNFTGNSAATDSNGNLGMYLSSPAYFDGAFRVFNAIESGGLYTATATGGSQGAGTINATAYYQNGTPISTGGGGLSATQVYQ